MNYFTKQHTQIAKGIAILMMLYHHLYILPERIEVDYFSLIDCIIPNAQITIAIFCKLCVCIYVFLSGYGLYHSLKKCDSLLNMYKKICIRAAKFWVSFVVIYLLFVTVGMFFGVFDVGWKHFVLGIFTLELGYFNNTWWFVNAYIILLFVIPLFVYLFSDKHLAKRIIVIGIYPLVYLLGRTFIYFFGSNVILECYFWYLENYELVLTLFVGVLCARFQIYERILQMFEIIPNIKHRKIIRTFIMLIVLALAITLRIIIVKDIADMRFDFIIAPLFVFAISTIIYDLKHYSIVVLCGNHSTNMWLTHAFLCYTYAQALVFLPYFSELVFIWFIVLSLIISYLTNLVLVPVDNYLYSKPHKFSFDGYFTFIKLKK